MTNISISWAKEVDLESVLSFYASCGYSGGVHSKDLILKATLGGQIVGAVRVSEEEGVFVLRGMQVDEKYQRQGLGKRLLKILQGKIGNRECYCLPYDYLENFYGLIKFEKIESEDLPQFLQERLKKYNDKGADVIGMKRPKIIRPSLPTLESLLDYWGIKGHPLFIRKVESFVYAVDEEPLILRVTERTHRSRKEIESELQWMKHLMDRGVHFAYPVPTTSGELVATSQGFTSELYAVLFKKAEGQPLLEDNQFTTELYKKVGEVIGKMHKATRSFEAETYRTHWDKQNGMIMSLEVVDPSDGHVDLAFIEALEWLKKLPQNNDNYGLIHADVHQGNFFVHEDGAITIFDFDDCHYNWFSYDIAVPIFSLFLRARVKDELFDFEKWFVALKEGYLKENEIEPIWLERVPLFFRFRTAFMYFWCKARIAKKDLEPDGLAWCEKCMIWCSEELKKPVQFF